jgi:serine/threonine protein kinase
LNELKKELENKEREVIEYRERLRLAEKEEKSEYYQNLWPIIYDKYQTLELLGSGGFGEVYKCYDLEKNKIVAIKRMKFESNISAKHF